jgi:3-hydroxyisobutyrate dehydrogenase
MGIPIAARVLAGGHALTVYDIDRERVVHAARLGAVVGTSAADVAQRSDIVMTCVTNGNALEAVLFGPSGLASVHREGALLADLSSVHPNTTCSLAERLLAASGMRWVDAPVSGGVRGAEAGTLAIFCGGAATDVDRFRPVSTLFAQRLTHFGGIGSGQVAKLCNQTLVGTTLVALAETMNLARRAGLDPAMLPEAFRGGFADSPPLQTWGPRMATGNFEPQIGSVSGLLKDLDAATDLARSCGAPLPMLAAAAEIMRLYAAGQSGHSDTASLIRLFDMGPR